MITIMILAAAGSGYWLLTLFGHALERQGKALDAWNKWEIEKQKRTFRMQQELNDAYFSAYKRSAKDQPQ